MINIIGIAHAERIQRNLKDLLDPYAPDWQFILCDVVHLIGAIVLFLLCMKFGKWFVGLFKRSTS